MAHLPTSPGEFPPQLGLLKGGVMVAGDPDSYTLEGGGVTAGWGENNIPAHCYQPSHGIYLVVLEGRSVGSDGSVDVTGQTGEI